MGYLGKKNLQIRLTKLTMSGAASYWDFCNEVKMQWKKIRQNWRCPVRIPTTQVTFAAPAPTLISSGGTIFSECLSLKNGFEMFAWD